MKDRIWKPLYAIWMDHLGWAKSVDGIARAFLTWKEAERFRKAHRYKHSIVKTMIPYLGWHCDAPAPKKMKDVEELTNYWKISSKVYEVTND